MLHVWGMTGCYTDRLCRQVVRSAVVDSRLAGCGLTSSASSVSKLWHRAARPLVGGELLCCLVMKCPVMADEWGARDKRLGVGSVNGCTQIERYPTCTKVLVLVFVCTDKHMGVCIPWSWAFLVCIPPADSSFLCSNCLFIARLRRPMVQGRQNYKILKC